MNFKEDATRYPLFLYQVGLEMGHLERFWPKSVPGGAGNGTPCTLLAGKCTRWGLEWDTLHAFGLKVHQVGLEMGHLARL